MARRKEWSLFYCTAEIDKALRECDNARAAKGQAEWERQRKGRVR